jgi:cell fate regulator YaaT (PSP1 superfamily)
MHNIVGVRYREGCKVYNFDAGDIALKIGDVVIVDSEQGMGVATAVTDVHPEERGPNDKPLKRVIRKANDDDFRRIDRNRALENEAFKVCQQKILEREMVMKLVRVEWAFDNSRSTFYFTADGRVDFRDLVKDLAHRFRIRIEMRQIGVRDEAKMIGGFGPCGRELCCASFLRDFEPVSIRMAKKQDLVLNPAKISGICGRLMCCLGYEYNFYDEAKKEARRSRCKGCEGTEKQQPARVEEEPKPEEAPVSKGPDEQADDKAAEKRRKKRNAWRKRRKKKKEGGGGEGGPGPQGGATGPASPE